MAFRDDFLDFDPTVAKRLDQLRTGFEELWHQGKRPQIEDMVADVTNPNERELAIQELIRRERELRLEAGESAALEDYLLRFPELSDTLSALFSRQKTIERQTFHIRCPQCQHSIEVAQNVPLTEIDCPSCGSSFGLEGDASTTTIVADQLGSAETMSCKVPSQKTIAHFTLMDELGVGAFGSVYKAYDTELHRTVAVKIPRRDQLNREETEQFLREARAAAQLAHPNIVSVHEVGRQDGSVYIVSDLIDGVSLADWLTGQSLTPRESATLCAKIAKALHHAHERGVVHRDMKPANILIDARAQPHITDFGLAKRDAGEMTMTMKGRILGTPAYMAPEQARGDAHSADRRADVYSLGVILFELLTGKRPFQGTMRMLLHQVIHEDAPSPRKFANDVPRDLETICLRCLEKNPVKRFQTAEELAKELERHLRGEPIQSRPISRAERLWRWGRRNPEIAITSLTLSACALIGFLTWRNVSERTTQMGNALESGQQRERRLNEVIQQRDVAAERSRFNLQLARATTVLGQDPHQAQSLLDDVEVCPQSLRDFTWHLLHHSAQHENTFPYSTVLDASVPITSLTISPDGKTLCASGWDSRAFIWDIAQGEKLFELQGHSNWIPSVAFSPEGTLIATASWDGCLRLWNAQTGEPWVASARRSSDPMGTTSPERVKISVEKRETVLGWPISAENITIEPGLRWENWRLCPGRLKSTIFSPAKNNRIIAILGGDNRVRVLHLDDLTQGPIIEPNEVTREFRPETDIGRVCFHPNGNWLSCGTDSGEIRIIDIENGSEVQRLVGHQSGVTGLAFSPEGGLLASGSRDHTIRLWKTDTWECISVLKGHHHAIYPVTFSPDGQTLASGSADKTIRLWDGKTGEFRAVLFGHQDQVWALAFTPNSRVLISGSWDRTIRLWSTTPSYESFD